MHFCNKETPPTKQNGIKTCIVLGYKTFSRQDSTRKISLKITIFFNISDICKEENNNYEIYKTMYNRNRNFLMRNLPRHVLQNLGLSQRLSQIDID